MSTVIVVYKECLYQIEKKNLSKLLPLERGSVLHIKICILYAYRNKVNQNHSKCVLGIRIVLNFLSRGYEYCLDEKFGSGNNESM